MMDDFRCEPPVGEQLKALDCPWLNEVDHSACNNPSGRTNNCPWSVLSVIDLDTSDIAEGLCPQCGSDCPDKVNFLATGEGDFKVCDDDYHILIEDPPTRFEATEIVNELAGIDARSEELVYRLVGYINFLEREKVETEDKSTHLCIEMTRLKKEMSIMAEKNLSDFKIHSRPVDWNYDRERAREALAHYERHSDHDDRQSTCSERRVWNLEHYITALEIVVGIRSYDDSI